MRHVGSFTSEGITKEEAQELKKEMAAIKELVKDGNFRLEALVVWQLDKIDLTQDQLDATLKLLKSYGRQRGFKVD
ncbi:MAG TPA: hypothetical protein ENH95_07690 [Nitrosopumilus sp.]|nr:hypothetical protein [Nitrosopumilus sp.]